MSLIKCKKCKKLISNKAIRCPHCGKVINKINPLASLEKLKEKIILFDLETTGFNFNNDEIIEFAGIEIDFAEGMPFPKKIYNPFIQLNNKDRLKNEVIELTGISKEILSNEGISKKQFFEEVKNFIFGESRTIMIAHNAQFDLNFLYSFLEQSNRLDLFSRIDAIDSLAIVKDRFYYPHKLKNAIEHYDLEGVVQNSHRGIDDVFAMYAVLIEASKDFDDIGKYKNIFGYSEKYGISGRRFSQINYCFQDDNIFSKLYNIK